MDPSELNKNTILATWFESPRAPAIPHAPLGGQLPLPSCLPLSPFPPHTAWGLFRKRAGVCVPSEKAVATYSSTLAWKIPWTKEPGRLQSMGSLRVGHD